MKTLYLVIALALSTSFCTVGSPPPAGDVSAVANATLTAIAAQTQTVSGPGQPTATPPSSAGSTVPSLVWISPEHIDVLPDLKVITVRNGKGAFEPPPLDIAIFWDYSAPAGRMAYASKTSIGNTGSRPTRKSVSDLWVYDYATGQTEMWLSNDVVRARWSPVIDPATSKATLAAILYESTLVLMTGPNESTVLSETASPDFSWSPDGRSIAYLNDDGLFVITLDGGQTRQLPGVVPGFGGWIGDKPVWAPDQQALIYAKAPIEVAALDGSRVFIPRSPAGESPTSDRALNILWSPEKHILAFDTDDGFLTGIWIYQLSPDMATILSSDFFETTQSEAIVAWWQPGESILLRTGEIWSISQKAVIDTIH